ncbi:hypothetical protein SCA6_005778 [Theobroma cacao]
MKTKKTVHIVQKISWSRSCEASNSLATLLGLEKSYILRPGNDMADSLAKDGVGRVGKLLSYRALCNGRFLQASSASDHNTKPEPFVSSGIPCLINETTHYLFKRQKSHFEV